MPLRTIPQVDVSAEMRLAREQSMPPDHVIAEYRKRIHGEMKKAAKKTTRKAPTPELRWQDVALGTLPLQEIYKIIEAMLEASGQKAQVCRVLGTASDTAEYRVIPIWK